MTPQVLPEYDSQFVPVDLGSRLYWIGQHYGASGVGPGELVLMSCDNDLRHVTELARFRAAGRVWNIGPSNLLAKGRSLYVLIAGSMDLAGHGAPGLERAQINGSSLTLFRIALKPQVSVQVAARFPNGVSKVLVDGARLYAVVDEVREKWFEWSGPGTGSMLEKSLYVYNLPE